MTVQLLYFDDCPNWRAARDVLKEVLGSDGAFELVAVTSPDEAVAAGMRGSPTILVDGRDPFSPPEAPLGLACRGGASEAVPSVEAVRAVLSG